MTYLKPDQVLMNGAETSVCYNPSDVIHEHVTCERMNLMPHLKLDQSLVNEARAMARHIVDPIIDYIGQHTTVAIERATLRLIGVDGVDGEDVPLPNRVVERATPLLPGGILRPFVATMLAHKLDVQGTAEAIGWRELTLEDVAHTDNEQL